MLAQGLPADAAIWREDGWTSEQELLATIAEVLDGWFRVLFAQWGGKPRGEPLRVRRPGAEEVQPRNVKVAESPEDVAEFFNRHAPRG